MKFSETRSEIAKALVEIQKEIQKIPKNAENPFYKSSYATLDSIIDIIKPICNKHDVVFMHDIDVNKISVFLLHVSGEWVKQEGMELPLEKNTAQGAGSVTTYGKRYTLNAMFGVSTDEDDDGNSSERSINQSGNSSYVQKNQGKRLDFKEVQAKLDDLKSPSAIDDYAKELHSLFPNMTTSQGAVIKKMFETARAELKVKEEFQGSII